MESVWFFFTVNNKPFELLEAVKAPSVEAPLRYYCFEPFRSGFHILPFEDEGIYIGFGPINGRLPPSDPFVPTLRINHRAHAAFCNLMLNSDVFRSLVIHNTWRQRHRTFSKINRRAVEVHFEIVNWTDTIDRTGNSLLIRYCMERAQLENTMAILSTLGGAYSALGDYFVRCAEMAGKISLKQLALCSKLEDPSLLAQCELYMAISLIQRREFRWAKAIVREKFALVKSGIIKDSRVFNMCLGIWEKLRYEWGCYKKEKRLKNSTIRALPQSRYQRNTQ